MKPRTKLQFEVHQLMNDVLGLSSDHKRFAEKEVASHIGYRKKKGVTCMDCGQFFDDCSSNKQITCPHCGASLDVQESKRRTYSEQEFFSIVTTYFGFQIIKYVYVQKKCKAGQKYDLTCREVCQNWIKDDSVTVVARPRLMNSAYITNPFSSGDMALRSYSHDIHDMFSKKMYFERVLPEYAKLGFTQRVDYIFPHSLLRQLKQNSKAETLLKAKQYELLSMCISHHSAIFYEFWDSIKICLRNNYYVDDATAYFDYLKLLKIYGKDLHNAHYVCPVNLYEAHDVYMNRKKRDDEIERKKRDAERLLRQIEKEKQFIESKKKFFDLLITNGDIKVIPLKSLEDFKNEGDTMHHCVFTNEYFSRNDSLILSARKDDQIIETVEVDLKRFDITQSRAAYNKNSEYHDDILNLVKRNMNIIKQKAAL